MEVNRPSAPCGSDLLVAKVVLGAGSLPGGASRHMGEPMAEFPQSTLCGSDLLVARVERSTLLVASLESTPTGRPHSEKLRKGRCSRSNLWYAITKCVEHRLPILHKTLPNGSPAQVIIESLRYLHLQKRCRCIGYTIMPDHVHFIIRLGETELPLVMKAFSNFSARRINGLLGRSGSSFWQDGYYDHALRGEKSLRAYLIYMAENPVRAGLCAKAEDWPYHALFPIWD